jgi:hypothetical protein
MKHNLKLVALASLMIGISTGVFAGTQEQRAINIHAVNEYTTSSTNTYINKMSINNVKFSCISGSYSAVSLNQWTTEDNILLIIAGAYGSQDCKVDKETTYFTLSSFDVQIENTNSQVQTCTIGNSERNPFQTPDVMGINNSGDWGDIDAFVTVIDDNEHYYACNDSSKISTATNGDLLYNGYWYTMDKDSHTGNNYKNPNDNITIFAFSDFNSN